MGEYRTIETDDGSFKAYVAMPDTGGQHTGAVVVLQEIFGVNAVMRGICDDLAADGFIAICPDLFWRLEPGVDITDQSPEEWKKALDLMGRFDVDKGVEDISTTMETIRAERLSNGKVGAVGYCLGGKLAFLTAARTNCQGAVSYYGVGLENLLDEAGKIREPLMLHIAAEDSFSSKEALKAVTEGLKDHGLVSIHVYEGRDHAFARPGGQHWHAEDAALANRRTREFFGLNLT